MTAAFIMLGHIAAVLVAGLWIGSGVAAGARRPVLALGLAAGGAAAVLGWIAVAAVLAGHGWWFAQEKFVLEIPLAVVTSAAAGLLAGPGLLRAAFPGRRGEAGAPDGARGEGRNDGQDDGAGEGTSGADGARVLVPLFAAGYSGLLGLVVTLVVGYPATVAVMLISLGVFAAAVVVTWLVVAMAGGRLIALAGAAALLLGGTGIVLGLAGPPASDAGGGAPIAFPARSGVSVESLTGPRTPESSGQVRTFRLDAKTATVTLSSGRTFAAWTFNGQVPGPAITVQQGDLVEVTLHNTDIAAGVTLHWHGYNVPGAEDGAPGLTQDAVMPGHDFVYRFVAAQTGTYWYHTHEDSDTGVTKGLYGAFIVQPRAAAAVPAAAGTPTTADLAYSIHTFDGHLALDPATADSAADAKADAEGLHTVAPGAAVRLRVIDTDNVTHALALSGVPYRLVAADGVDLDGPGELSKTRLPLAAGARYDLEFTMPAGPVDLFVDDGAARLRLSPSAGAAGASAAAAPAASTASWPDLDLLTYGTARPDPLGTPNRSFTLVLDRGLVVGSGATGYDYTVNGEAAPDVPTLTVAQGDVVELTVVNRSGDTHPWHLHGSHVLVLSRDGRAPTGSPLWLDTFEVKPGQVWKVAFKADNPGLWMMHCHNLAHAAHGMSMVVAYAGIVDPFHGMPAGG